MSELPIQQDPTPADFERTRRALRWIIWPSYLMIIGGGVAFLGLGISQRPDLTLLFHGLGLAVVVGAHVLTERGALRWASDLLILMFWVIYAFASGFSGGTTSPYMGGFLLVVVGGGVLRGSWMGLLTATASILTAAGFVLAERNGALPASLMPMTPAFNLISWVLVISMTAVLLHLTLGELQKALSRAQSSERALAGALEDLHQTSVSKESVERVLLGLGDAVFVLDADHRIREVNPKAASLLGREALDLSGVAFEDLMDPKMLEQPHAEGPLQTISGPVHVSVSTAPLQGTRGELDGVVVVAHDIDERVAAEERIRVAAEEAEVASHAKSSFLATMSHELRTPLNAIIGYSEFVQEELTDPELIDDLSRIERSGKDLLTLINDVLDLSKIEAGKVEIEMREVDLLQLLDEVTDQITPLIARHDNRFEVEVDEGIGQAYTDPTRLRQILRNLLSNAAKFTEGGVITLRVRHVETMASFEVSDTGVGMTPAQLDKVWQPFAQAEVSTTRKFGGTGLGLPISRHLCELLGGSIEATSELGIGTTFTAILPMDAPS